MAKKKPDSASTENRKKPKAATKAAETKDTARDEWKDVALQPVESIKVRLDQLRYETARKVRKEPDMKIVAQYADIWQDYLEARKKYKEDQEAGKENLEKPQPTFPRIKVVKVVPPDGEPYYEVASGEKRSLSAKEAGIIGLKVDVIEGTPEQLLKFAISENQKHGLRPSSEDIACCIKSLREIDPKITIRAMAGIIGTSKSTTERILSQMGQDSVKEKVKEKKEFDLTAFCKTMTNRLEKELGGLKKESVELLVDHVDQIVHILEQKKWDNLFIEQIEKRLWRRDDETGKS